jgi:hypothetical protein
MSWAEKDRDRGSDQGELANAMTLNDRQGTNAPPLRQETRATVIACHYQFAMLNTLNLGVGPDANDFRISFVYESHGKGFHDEFRSPVALAYNETFGIRYNTLQSRHNTTSTAALPQETPLSAMGIVVSIFLSSLYLLTMHGWN